MEKLIIHTLGEFYLQYGDKLIGEQQKRSKKMWLLLQYFVTFHKREIPQNELIELLWPSEQSNNPAGALKTQLYRLRMTLDECGLPGGDIILSSTGAYVFNNGLDYEIDAEVFEQQVREAERETDEQKKFVLLKKAVSIYSGGYLAKYSDEQWVMPLNSYYRSLYTRAVHALLELLQKNESYDELLSLGRRFAAMEPLDEKAHCFVMKALCEMGDYQAAKAHYVYVLDHFYNSEGINPSQEFISFYNELMKSDNEQGGDITYVKTELSEEKNVNGAFFCEYEAFRYIFRLELRYSKRSEKPVTLCVLTVSGAEKSSLSPKQLHKVMSSLNNSILENLRASDVYSRYSANQFIMLCPGANAANCEQIAARIIRSFRHNNPRQKFRIDTSFDQVVGKK